MWHEKYYIEWRRIYVACEILHRMEEDLCGMRNII